MINIILGIHRTRISIRNHGTFLCFISLLALTGCSSRKETVITLDAVKIDSLLSAEMNWDRIPSFMRGKFVFTRYRVSDAGTQGLHERGMDFFPVFVAGVPGKLTVHEIIEKDYGLQIDWFGERAYRIIASDTIQLNAAGEEDYRKLSNSAACARLLRTFDTAPLNVASVRFPKEYSVRGGLGMLFLSEDTSISLSFHRAPSVAK